MRFVIYRETAGFWYWQLEDEEGQVAYGSRAFPNLAEITAHVHGIAAACGSAAIDTLPEGDA
jgi:hypothetical protein